MERLLWLGGAINVPALWKGGYMRGCGAVGCARGVEHYRWRSELGACKIWTGARVQKSFRVEALSLNRDIQNFLKMQVSLLQGNGEKSWG